MTPLEMFREMENPQISFLEFAMSLDGWEVRPVHRNGGLVAVLKFKGPEFHFWSAGNHSFTRQEIRQVVLEPLWNEYGFARTRTPVSDVRQQRFNERAGFRRIEEDDHEIHYQLDKI
jgi:hypothetical protein